MSDEEDKSAPLPASGAEKVRVVPAEQVLAGAREVWIEYNGVRYLLRVTRRGRLILTK